MADLTTIPDPPADHTEIFRVLLLATAATFNLSPGRGGAVVQTGSPTFITDGTVDTVLDGLRPWSPGGSQGDLRLRQSGDGFSAWAATLPSGTTIRLRMATSAESVPDSVRTMSERNRGSGYWNWEAPVDLDTVVSGDTVALALDVDVDYGQDIATSDAALSVEAGEPTVATTPTFTHTSDASFSAEAGEPTASFTPETTTPSTNASFGVEAGEPEFHAVPEYIAPSLASFTAESGLPTVATYPEFIAPSFASFRVQSHEPTVYIDKGFRNASFEAESSAPTFTVTPEAVKERNPAAEASAHQVARLRITTTADPVRTTTTV